LRYVFFKRVPNKHYRMYSVFLRGGGELFGCTADQCMRYDRTEVWAILKNYVPTYNKTLSNGEMNILLYRDTGIHYLVTLEKLFEHVNTHVERYGDNVLSQDDMDIYMHFAHLD